MNCHIEEFSFHPADKEIQEDFLSLLNQLSKTRMLSTFDFCRVFQARKSNGIVTAVAYYDGKLIGTASIKFEWKYSYGTSIVGQIEDVVVDDRFRHRGIAKQLIEYLIKIAKNKNCRKVILNCKDDLVPFYQRYGFNRVGNEMRIDL